MDNNEEIIEGINLMTPEEMNSSASEETTPTNSTEETTTEETSTELPPEVETFLSEPTTSEKIEETPVQEITEKPEEPEEPESSNESTLELQAKALVEEGIWEQEDIENFDGTVNGYIAIQKAREEKVAKKVFDNWRETLDPHTKKVLGLMEEGLDTDFATRAVQNLDYLNSISEEKLSEEDSEDARKAIITEDFLQRGFSEEEAKEMTTDIFDLGKDVDKAKAARKNLISKNEALVEEEKKRITQAKEQERADAEKQFENLKTDINNTKELYPGYQATDKHREALLKEFTEANEKGLTPVESNRSVNPYEWDKAIRVLNMLGVLNINEEGKWNPDFSKVVNAENGSAIESLKERLGKQKPMTGASMSLNSKQESKDTLFALEQKIKNQ